MKISAKIIAHSIANNIELITTEWCYPRFIHSEVMTHRMFSRNASSSRAIPIEKMIKQVEENPAMPIHWGKNQPGMQARKEFEGGEKLDLIEDWKDASIEFISFAKHFNALGVHKQIVNRLLEPFQWMKVIVTATEWDNFFVLRLPFDELNDRQKQIALKWKMRFNDHPNGIDAQPEIQQLARCMKQAMEESTPVELKTGEWHLPYTEFPGPRGYEISLETAIKRSVARCARVSYNNHDNSSPNIEKDIALADKLLAAGHMSPFEHIATPMKSSFCEDEVAFRDLEKGITHIARDESLWSGNFRGWIQYRQLVNN